MAKGQTAMDVKIKIMETIKRAIQTSGQIDIKRTKAVLVMQSGYSYAFIDEIFKTLEDADIIFIDELNNTARFTAEENKKQNSTNEKK